MAGADGEKYTERVANFLDDTRLVSQLIFAIKSDDGSYKLYHAPLTRDGTNLYRKDFHRKVARLRKKDEERYSPAGNDPTHLIYENENEIKGAKKILREPDEAISSFDEIVDKLKFTIFRFQDAERREVWIFRRYRKALLLAEEKWYKLMFRGERLSPTRKDIIVAHPEIDCIWYSGVIIVRNRENFQSIFGYVRDFTSDAETVFQNLGESKNFTIANLEGITASCNRDLRKLTKLSQIQTTGDYMNWSYGYLKEFCTARGVKGVRFNDENNGIIFDRDWDFLHLFGDCHLDSGLTKRKYLAANAVPES